MSKSCRSLFYYYFVQMHGIMGNCLCCIVGNGLWCMYVISLWYALRETSIADYVIDVNVQLIMSQCII